MAGGGGGIMHGRGGGDNACHHVVRCSIARVFV